MVSGFTADSDVAAPVPDPQVPVLVAAGDPDLAAALYDRDPAWAPFFCPVCERSYCAVHWQGTRCPYGH